MQFGSVVRDGTHGMAVTEEVETRGGEDGRPVCLDERQRKRDRVSSARKVVDSDARTGRGERRRLKGEKREKRRGRRRR